MSICSYLTGPFPSSNLTPRLVFHPSCAPLFTGKIMVIANHCSKELFVKNYFKEFIDFCSTEAGKFPLIQLYFPSCYGKHDKSTTLIRQTFIELSDRLVG